MLSQGHEIVVENEMLAQSAGKYKNLQEQLRIKNGLLKEKDSQLAEARKNFVDATMNMTAQ